MHALMSFSLDPVAAEPLIEEIAQYPAFLFDADERRYDLLQLRGKTREAEALAEKLRAGHEGWSRKYEEFMPWKNQSIPEPPGAAHAEVKRIQSVLGKAPQVEDAYLARMTLPDLPGLAPRVLVVSINLGRFYTDAEEQYEKLSQKLFEELDDWTLSNVRILPSKDKDCKKAVEKLQRYKIYSNR